MIILINEKVINLINCQYKVDGVGNDEEIEIYKEVFAVVTSISQSEYFNAGQNGLKPSLKIIVNSFEYEDEKEIDIEGKIYSVYRTFNTKNEKTELYVTEKAGIYGK